MVRQLAAALSFALAVPAAALACEGHQKQEQVSNDKSSPVLLAQAEKKVKKVKPTKAKRTPLKPEPKVN